MTLSTGRTPGQAPLLLNSCGMQRLQLVSSLCCRHGTLQR